MMGAILNSANLNSTILDSKLWLLVFQSDSKSFILSQLDDGSHLEFCLLAFNHFAPKKLHSFILTQLDDGSHHEFYHVGFSHYAQTLTQTNSIWIQTHSFSVILMMVAFFNLAILDLTILVFPLILTHTCQDWFPPSAHQKTNSHLPPHHLHKKTSFLHSDSNLMMAAILNFAILNSAILDSAILHKTLTQTNSIWLKVIHSQSTWWWQPSWILPCLHSTILHKKKTCLTHSQSTWWWQPSWTLPCWIQTLPSWIQTPCYPFSDSLKNTLTPIWLWLKLIQSDSNSFILT